MSTRVVSDYHKLHVLINYLINISEFTNIMYGYVKEVQSPIIFIIIIIVTIEGRLIMHIFANISLYLRNVHLFTHHNAVWLLAEHIGM